MASDVNIRHDRLRDLASRAVLDAAAIRTTTDLHKTEVERTETWLLNLRLGFDFWILIDDDEALERNEVGFAKTKGRWAISIRRTALTETGADAALPETFLFAEAPRRLRFSAAAALWPLTEKAIHQTRLMAEEIEERLVDIQTLNSALYGEPIAEKRSTVRPIRTSSGTKAEGGAA